MRRHAALMARLARRVGDRRILKLIRRCLDAGRMVAGVKAATVEGTPHCSPLSPLLANIMLDDLDHELDRRGHAFARYVDDLRVYVASQRAAQRVLDGVTVFVEQRLKLKGEPGQERGRPGDPTGHARASGSSSATGR
jgi:RNA-directed DNA polymerase